MARFEAITGKYVYVEVQGVEYRVYFEESGQGIPLLCQHTAGAESLQWRHLMNDQEVTSRFRVIAADLPYHGKSLPPESAEWWKQEYRLTKSFFMSFLVNFSHALRLKKPVLTGCSIGGNIALDLALEYPNEFRAVVGFGGAESTPGFDMIWWDHPRVGGHFRSADPYGATSPYCPENYRREVGWVLGKSAPPILRGDSYYYSVEHDLTDKLDQIDTSRLAVYLLAPEYDFASTPEMSQKTASKIKGARYAEMKKLGHFAMAENYDIFRKYLVPIISEIAQHSDK
jgi:pimeloyl-ACP methyl ester carboxylesterase